MVGTCNRISRPQVTHDITPSLLFFAGRLLYSTAERVPTPIMAALNPSREDLAETYLGIVNALRRGAVEL